MLSYLSGPRPPKNDEELRLIQKKENARETYVRLRNAIQQQAPNEQVLEEIQTTFFSWRQRKDSYRPEDRRSQMNDVQKEAQDFVEEYFEHYKLLNTLVKKTRDITRLKAEIYTLKKVDKVIDDLDYAGKGHLHKKRRTPSAVDEVFAKFYDIHLARGS